jgi:hypothetical protein
MREPYRFAIGVHPCESLSTSVIGMAICSKTRTARQDQDRRWNAAPLTGTSALGEFCKAKAVD